MTPEEIIISSAQDNFIPFCCLVQNGFIPSWHHRDIAEKLEAVERGEIKRLMLFMPPRHGKTTEATILFPDWYLGKHPDEEVITVSYSAELATDFGEKARDTIRSKEYQAIFNTQIKTDSESRQRWKTSKGGAYTSVGLGGPITGRGADLLIIDDPIKNQEEALSDTYREKVWKYYTSTLYTRLQKDAKVILILTRWHQDDLAGRLIEAMEHAGGEPWTIVRYPAIAEEDELYRKEGEALWPEQFDLPALENIKKTIGIYDWSALYQQNPLSEAAAEFKKEYFKYFTDMDLIGKDLEYYVMVDPAISQKKSADNTSIQVIAKERFNPNIYHIEEFTGRYDPLELIERLFHIKNKYGTKLVKVGIETVQYQKALKFFILEEQRKRESYFDIVELKAGGTSKEARIRGLLPLYKSGILYHRTTDVDLENELLTFPVGKHDDRIDALAYLQQLVINTPISRAARTYVPKLKRY